MLPIPPAPDVLPATTAGRIAVAPFAAAAPTKPAVGLANDEMSRLIKRGQDFLNQGDFAAARLLFKRAADAGSAEAALALGSTYDPVVIKKLGAVAVSPDVERALKWYATAADRGSFDAAERYAELIHAH
jgi:TPR repeat protein